ncbi:ATJ20 [Symbiodinium microadriaticum]|nr:ATJ20 [Symbiodinium microadriaticum]
MTEDARDAVRRAGGAALPPPSFGGPGSEFERRAVQLTGFTPGDESVGIESMTEMCANFGPVFFVKLHRERNPDVNGENPFNGTVQVEFESEEAAVAIVAMEHHLMWKDQKIQAFRAAVLRLSWLAGVDAEELLMPELANSVYTWAHLGKAANAPKPRRRSEHVQQLAREFANGVATTGIQEAMRLELKAVEAAIRIRLALGGSLEEVTLLNMVPADTPGKLDGRALIACTRPRGLTEATTLMWATRQGVRWVQAILRLGANASKVTPSGWSALLYGAAFESRKMTADGSSDSGDASYGGYRHRTRGVVGPLIDAGADPNARTLQLKAYQSAFSPSPLACQCRLCDVRRKREEQCLENQQQESKGTEEARAARKRRLEEDAEEAARYEERGLVLRFDDVPSSVSWRDLKEGLSPYGRVRFVRFCKEEEKRFALVQMKDEEGIFAILGCAKEDEGFLCVQSRSIEVSFYLTISGTVSLFVSPSWNSSSRGSNTAGSLTRAGYRGVSRKAFEGMFVAKKPEKTSEPQAPKAEAGSPSSAKTGFPSQQAPPHHTSQQRPAASRTSPQDEANGISSFAALMQKKPPGLQTPPSEQGLPARSASTSQTRPAPPASAQQRAPNGFGSSPQPVPTQTRQTSSGFPSAMPSLSGFPSPQGTSSGFPRQPAAEAQVPTGFGSPPKPADTQPPSFQPQPQPTATPPVTEHAAKSSAPPPPPKPPSPSPPPQAKQANAPTSSPGVSDTSGASSQQTAGVPVNGATKPDDSSFYAILGVAEGAALSEIRAAYRQQARKSHPDLFRTASPEEQEAVAERFSQVNKAFDVLSDPAKKQAYDLRGLAGLAEFEFDGERIIMPPPWRVRIGHTGHHFWKRKEYFVGLMMETIDIPVSVIVKAYNEATKDPPGVGQAILVERCTEARALDVTEELEEYGIMCLAEEVPDEELLDPAMH